MLEIDVSSEVDSAVNASYISKSYLIRFIKSLALMMNTEAWLNSPQAFTFDLLQATLLTAAPAELGKREIHFKQ